MLSHKTFISPTLEHTLILVSSKTPSYSSPELNISLYPEISYGLFRKGNALQLSPHLITPTIAAVVQLDGSTFACHGIPPDIHALVWGVPGANGRVSVPQPSLHIRIVGNTIIDHEIRASTEICATEICVTSKHTLVGIDLAAHVSLRVDCPLLSRCAIAGPEPDGGAVGGISP
jgi:hypothetical protein